MHKLFEPGQILIHKDETKKPEIKILDYLAPTSSNWGLGRYLVVFTETLIETDIGAEYIHNHFVIKPINYNLVWNKIND